MRRVSAESTHERSTRFVISLADVGITPFGVIIAAFVAVATALPVLALSGSTDLPAAVTEPAERLPGEEEDVVTVYNSGALTSDVAQRAMQAVTAAGGTGEIGRSASTGMQRVRRGAAIVQQAPLWCCVSHGDDHAAQTSCLCADGGERCGLAVVDITRDG